VPAVGNVSANESPIVAQVQARRGGQLDMLAENIVGNAQSTGQGWWSSVFGGSRS